MKIYKIIVMVIIGIFGSSFLLSKVSRWAILSELPTWLTVGTVVSVMLGLTGLSLLFINWVEEREQR